MKLALLALMLFCPSAFGAQNLTIDAGHSAVVFSWNHLGFTNPIARFEIIEGTLALDTANLARSSVSISLPLTGLHTGVAALDARLKTDEFLDAAHFPDITFHSTAVERVGKDRLKIMGDLTIHGTLKSIVLDAKINRIGVNPISKLTTVGFDADVVLRRSDFGVSKYVPAITDDLHVHITLGAEAQG